MKKRIRKINAGFTLDEDIVNCIEQERGIAKKSTYVNQVLRKAMMNE